MTYPSHFRSVVHDAVEDACAAHGFKPVAAHEVAETATLVSFVAAGLGVSLVPASVRKMTVEGAVYRPLADDATRVELAAAWRRDDDRPVLMRALDVIRGHTRARITPRSPCIREVMPFRTVGRRAIVCSPTNAEESPWTSRSSAPATWPAASPPVHCRAARRHAARHRDTRRPRRSPRELPGDVRTGQVGDPLTGDVVVLAVWYQAVPDVLARYGDQLDGKIVVDITNPVDPRPTRR